LIGKHSNLAEYTIQMILNQIETYHPNPQEIAKKYDSKKVKNLSIEEAQQWIMGLMFILSDLFQEQIDNNSKIVQNKQGSDQINIADPDKECDQIVSNESFKSVIQVQNKENLEN
jgi:hypothetical protein